MTARPYMKWFPSDWRGEPRLRMCSLAARGLWADMLSYMHEGQPYGHLTIDGVAPDTAEIASLIGRPASEVRKALNELESRQVFSRTDAGVIYSRRMVRDHKKSLKGKEYVEKRWANREPIRSPNRSSNSHPTYPPNTYSPESRKDAADAAPSDDQRSPEARVFDRGKQVLGQNAGGLIKRLIAAKNQNPALAMAAIEVASTKQNPREYIGAIVNGNESETKDWRSAIV